MDDDRKIENLHDLNVAFRAWQVQTHAVFQTYKENCYGICYNHSTILT